MADNRFEKEWDVSKVKDMKNMFNEAELFPVKKEALPFTDPSSIFITDGSTTSHSKVDPVGAFKSMIDIEVVIQSIVSPLFLGDPPT